MNFKDTEIGRIPFEWDVRMIQDVAEVVSGATPKTKVAEYWDGNIAWITPKDLSNHTERYIYRGDRMITDEGLKNSSAKLLPKGSVLFSSRAPIGYTAIAAQELCTNQGFKSMICNQQILDNNFMFYMMNYKKNEIENIAGGSTFKEVSGKTVKEFKIPIPPLDEQKAIAKVLSNLDEKIERNNKINKKLEEMAQAIFKQWFIDFEFPNEDGKPYKSSGGEMVESELGMIPKRWEIGSIGDYAKVKSGFAFKSAWWEERGIPVIKIKDISNNTINFNDISYVSEDKVDSAKDFIVNGGDLLIAMTGATIGKFAIVPPRKSNVLVNQRVGKFFLGENPLKKLGFIYCVLCRDEVYSQIVSRGDGSAQPNISPSNIESIKIILPSKDMIEKFNASVSCMFEKIIRNVEECNKLIALRDTLLPKLMSGEIRVPVEN